MQFVCIRCCTLFVFFICRINVVMSVVMYVCLCLYVSVVCRYVFRVCVGGRVRVCVCLCSCVVI